MTYILIIFGGEAYILIDPRSTHSFISCTFFMHANMEMRPLDCILVVTTLVSNSLLTGSAFRDCSVRVGNNDMVENLIPLDIHDFNAIWMMN